MTAPCGISSLQVSKLRYGQVQHAQAHTNTLGHKDNGTDMLRFGGIDMHTFMHALTHTHTQGIQKQWGDATVELVEKNTINT